MSPDEVEAVLDRAWEAGVLFQDVEPTDPWGPPYPSENMGQLVERKANELLCGQARVEFTGIRFRDGLLYPRWRVLV